MKTLFATLLLALSISPVFAQGRGYERHEQRRPEVRVNINRRPQRPRFEIRIGNDRDYSYNRGQLQRVYNEGYRQGYNNCRYYRGYSSPEYYGDYRYRDAFIRGYNDGFRSCRYGR